MRDVNARNLSNGPERTARDADGAPECLLVPTRVGLGGPRFGASLCGSARSARVEPPPPRRLDVYAKCSRAFASIVHAPHSSEGPET